MTQKVHTHIQKSFSARVVFEDNKKRIKVEHPHLLQFETDKFQIGDFCTLVVVHKKLKRTLQQNAFYHVYLEVIARETGHGVEELHEFFKGKFLTSKIANVLGEQVRIKKSTTSLSVTDFSEYMTKIEQLVNIPIPDTTPYQLPRFKEDYV